MKIDIEVLLKSMLSLMIPTALVALSLWFILLDFDMLKEIMMGSANISYLLRLLIFVLEIGLVIYLYKQKIKEKIYEKTDTLDFTNSNLDLSSTQAGNFIKHNVIDPVQLASSGERVDVAISRKEGGKYYIIRITPAKKESSGY